jgi:hypothetical protein
MLHLIKVSSFSSALLLLSFLGVVRPGRAQDNVTIPKSRLEELERKEKELERLKTEQDKAKKPATAAVKKREADTHAEPAPPVQASPVQPQPVQPPPVAPPAVQSQPVHSPPVEPIVSYVSPPMDSLPPLQPFDIVESMDLANYYHADARWADARFRKQKLTVRGEIVGFEKPLWNRTYQVMLKTPTREARVVCDLLPPDKANAIYTANHGEELVALMGETKVPIAKVGQTITVKGECKGLKDSVILIMAREFQPAR